MILLTDNAVNRLKELLVEVDDETQKLRIFVEGGGCSGFQYGFSLDHVVSDDDIVISKDNVDVLVDAMSMTYLDNSTVDFQTSLAGSGFVISNPNSTSKCGCGSSFSV